MRRILAILLLAFLPLQFSWAAVASYCGHESQAAKHFGHHEHKHEAGAGDHDLANANPDLSSDAGDGKALGAMDLDCSHCHGTCSVMLTLPSALLGALRTVPPSTSLDESGGAHASARPERPQWLPLA